MEAFPHLGVLLWHHSQVALWSSCSGKTDRWDEAEAAFDVPDARLYVCVRAGKVSVLGAACSSALGDS